MNSPGTVRVGTRGSPLALAQTNAVVTGLKQAQPDLEVEVRTVRTAADRAPHLALSAIGDKALWVADLEQQLLAGEIDLAVHSMKDLPAELPPGLVIGAIPEREAPLDALVLPAAAEHPDPRLADLAYAANAIHFAGVMEAMDTALPRGARVGTSSDRRKGQILLGRPDLQVLPVRGNVDTRLKKLDAGEFDVLILAAAGLRRLGLDHRISLLIPARRMVPAAGQGALAIEIRAEDSGLQELLESVHHGQTAAAVAAERAFVRHAGGGCSVPLGAYTSFPSGCLELWVRAVSPSPSPDLSPIQDLQIAEIPAATDPFSDLSWAEDLGRKVAERFLRNGGAEFLRRLQGAA